MQDYSVVIQAGGLSTRMGEDKGLLQFGDKKLVEYVLEQVSGMGENNFIVSNKPNDYSSFGLPVYQDTIPGVGALGGFHTIFSYLETDYAVVLACDMPFVNQEFLKYMVSIAQDFDVVVPRLHSTGHVEPFRAIYSKRCKTAVERAIESKRRRVISFFDDVKVRYVEDNEIRKYDPEELMFFNINTREELHKALQISRNLLR